MARRFETQYRTKTGDNLGDPEHWNRRFEDIDRRVGANEKALEDVDAVADRVESVALERIDNAITPIVEETIDRVQSISSLFSAESVTSVVVGLGVQTLTVIDGQRDTFAVTEWVTVQSQDDPAVGMTAQVTSYDQDTGALVLDVVDTSGSGTYDRWRITVSPPLDVAHTTRTDNPHNVTAAQVGAATPSEVSAAVSTSDAATRAAFASADDVVRAELASGLAAKANVDHQHSIGDIDGLSTTVAQAAAAAPASSLAQVATSGSAAHISGLAAVATTGSAASLSGTLASARLPGTMSNTTYFRSAGGTSTSTPHFSRSADTDTGIGFSFNNYVSIFANGERIRVGSDRIYPVSHGGMFSGLDSQAWDSVWSFAYHTVSNANVKEIDGQVGAQEFAPWSHIGIDCFKYNREVELKGSDVAKWRFGPSYQSIVAAYAEVGIDPLHYGIVHLRVDDDGVEHMTVDTNQAQWAMLAWVREELARLERRTHEPQYAFDRPRVISMSQLIRGLIEDGWITAQEGKDWARRAALPTVLMAVLAQMQAVDADAADAAEITAYTMTQADRANPMLIGAAKAALPAATDAEIAELLADSFDRWSAL